MARYLKNGKYIYIHIQMSLSEHTRLCLVHLKFNIIKITFNVKRFLCKLNALYLFSWYKKLIKINNTIFWYGA